MKILNNHNTVEDDTLAQVSGGTSIDNHGNVGRAPEKLSSGYRITRAAERNFSLACKQLDEQELNAVPGGAGRYEEPDIQIDKIITNEDYIK